MEFIETSVFTRLIDALLDAEQYRALQDALILRREAGDLIQGTEGLRKIRLGCRRSRETRRSASDLLLQERPRTNLLLVRLPKEQARRFVGRTEIGADQAGQGRMEMKDEDFAELVESVKEAGAIMRGEVQPSRRIEVTSLDIKAIREGTKKSQNEFALMIGVSLGTLRNWEQGRRRPDGPARALLKVVAQNPAYVEQVLLH